MKKGNKKRKLIIVFILILSVCFISTPQFISAVTYVEFEGTVDNQFNTKLKDAKVQLLINDNVVKTVYTDSNGYYYLSYRSQLGTYKLRVSKIDHITQTKNVPRFSLGEPLIVNYELVKSALKYAIIVGISDYKMGGDLNYCDEDASDWYNHLKNNLEFDYIWVYGDGHTSNYPQHDGKAKEYIVRYRLNYIKNEVDSDDTFAFIFAGHGSTYPIDACNMWDAGSGEFFQDGYLTPAELFYYFDDNNAGKNFIFMDCCYSEFFAAYDIDMFYNHETIYVAAACQDYQSSYELSEFENGQFTYWFLEDAWINTYSGSRDVAMETLFASADYNCRFYSIPYYQNPEAYDGDATTDFKF